MLGCFSVHPAKLREGEPVLPEVVELTDSPRNDREDIRQSYAVHFSQRDVPMWSWMPVTTDQAHVSLGNGFTGWELTLTKAPSGFRGSARLFSDAVGWVRAMPVELIKIECR
jgi:hypothetical protein